MTLEQSQRTLARARAKAHKTVDDFPLVTIADASNRLESRRVTGLLGTESVFVDVTGVTEDLIDDDLIRVWPQPDKAGIYKFHSFVKRSGTNTVGDVFVPNLQTNLVKGPHGFAVEVFDVISQPGIGHQSKLEWSQANGVWRIHAANDGTAAGLDVQKGNISLAAGYTVDGVDVSGLDNDAIKKTLVDAKGDLIVATADDTVTRLAAGGTDGAVLIESSAAATGLAWSTQLKLAATETVVNDAGADVDFRVEGDTDPNLFMVDAGLDTTAIGGAAVASQKLTAYAGGAAVVPLVIQEAAAQSANALQVKDSAGTVLAAFEARGTLICNLGTHASNFFIGQSAGNTTMSGEENTCIGYYTGHALTTGEKNYFLGRVAGYNTTTGRKNVFIGRAAGFANIGGYECVYIGENAGYDNTAGYGNVCIGNEAGGQSSIPWTGYRNVYIGQKAGYSARGSLNVMIGYNAGGSAGVVSNQLYIANSNTSTPLIYGEFDGAGGVGVKIHTPTAAAVGFTVKGAASQSADLAQLQTSAAAVRRSWDARGLDKLMADQVTDTAPNDDTTLKKLTLQKLAAAPSNAAYIAFQQCPGTDVFYLVLEEG
jgi:hypothetical protein